MGLFGKNRSKWPTVIASIDEWGAIGNKANVSGSFTIDGEFYSVVVDREFSWPGDAEAWIAKVEATQTLTVRYNPDDPNDNIPEDFLK